MSATIKAYRGLNLIDDWYYYYDELNCIWFNMCTTIIHGEYYHIWSITLVCIYTCTVYLSSTKGESTWA